MLGNAEPGGVFTVGASCLNLGYFGSSVAAAERRTIGGEEGVLRDEVEGEDEETDKS
jgi:hypothetical protein